MKAEELKRLLHSILSNWEDEVVEFKRGGAGFSTGEIGEYFSALANEANLRCLPRAWLVFGVDNKTHKVVGTGEQYRRIFIDFLRRFPGITRRKINELIHDGRNTGRFNREAEARQNIEFNDWIAKKWQDSE